VTARTSKGSDTAAEVSEPEETQEESAPVVAAASKSRKKPVRRVRVIEVIDDEDDGEDLDLDEVLATADLADEAEAEEAEEEEEEPPPPPKARKKPVVEEPPAEKAAPPRKLRTALGNLRVLLVVAVVLIAALASWGIFEWRRAADLQSAKSDRAQVTKLVSRFGNVVMAYDLSDIAGSAAKIKPYLTGDALTSLQNTQSELQANAAKTTVAAGAGFKSKTDAVYVKDVNGKLASAVLIWTMSVSQGGNTQPVLTNIGLTVDLIKDGGTWKIAKYTATSSLAQLNLNGTGATPTPTPTK
jgi:hypothetical protein